MEHTIFSHKLLIAKKDINETKIYISDKLSDYLDLSLGDKVTLTFENGTQDFFVAAIYDDDERYVGGTMMICWNTKMEELFGKTNNYNGAFISSNNYLETKESLKNYKPLGDLRPREDFISDEVYQLYLESRENTDYTLQIFYKDLYMAETSSRNDSRLNKNLLLVITITMITIITFSVMIISKSIKYIKYTVELDIKNNFTIKQEYEMFNHYFIKLFVTVFLMLLVCFVVNNLVNKIALFSILHIVFLLLVFSVSIIIWFVQHMTFKSKIGKFNGNVL